MRILLVEDEPSAATMLAKGLREEAYAVDIAFDGETAQSQAFVNDYAFNPCFGQRPACGTHM